MRILVFGAGAVGGYFGGRLLKAGRDVSFLVRPARAAHLAQHGLRIQSAAGDVHLPSPPTLLASELREPFDVILVSCKAYDLDEAIAAIAPAVGPQTAIIPLLNGMRHLGILDQHFGTVLGGQCFISARLDGASRVIHLSPAHELVFGPRSEAQAAVADSIAATLSGAGFDVRLSPQILQDMWEKWVFLATFAGMTCLTRSAVGDIVAAGGSDLTLALLDECLAIATEAGYPTRPASLARFQGVLTDPDSAITASMLGDVERCTRIEADHILGDLLQRRSGTDRGSLLRIAHTALKAHEARIAREEADPASSVSLAPRTPA